MHLGRGGATLVSDVDIDDERGADGSNLTHLRGQHRAVGGDLDRLEPEVDDGAEDDQRADAPGDPLDGRNLARRAGLDIQRINLAAAAPIDAGNPRTTVARTHSSEASPSVRPNVHST